MQDNPSNDQPMLSVDMKPEDVKPDDQTGSSVAPSTSANEAHSEVVQTINRYLILYSCKLMLDDIEEYYKLDELNFNVCNETIHKMHVLHAQFNHVTDVIIKFVKDNSDAILKKHDLPFPVLSFDDIRLVDINHFCMRGDVHTDTLYSHLKTLLYFANGGVSNEELFVDKLISNFTPQCKAIADKIRATNTNVTDTENLELISNTFRTDLEKIKDDEDKYDTELIVKIICIKLKNYITNDTHFAAIFGNKIDKDELLKLVDIGIVDDLETITQNQFEMMMIVSRSGLLSHFKMETLFDNEAVRAIVSNSYA